MMAARDPAAMVVTRAGATRPWRRGLGTATVKYPWAHQVFASIARGNW